MPDEGKVEWAKNVRAGYLDQHAVLEKRNDDPGRAEICICPGCLRWRQRMNQML